MQFARVSGRSPKVDVDRKDRPPRFRNPVLRNAATSNYSALLCVLNTAHLLPDATRSESVRVCGWNGESPCARCPGVCRADVLGQARSTWGVVLVQARRGRAVQMFFRSVSASPPLLDGFHCARNLPCLRVTVNAIQDVSGHPLHHSSCFQTLRDGLAEEVGDGLGVVAVSCCSCRDKAYRTGT